jgi:hypothetical protein
LVLTLIRNGGGFLFPDHPGSPESGENCLACAEAKDISPRDGDHPSKKKIKNNLNKVWCN